MLSKLHRVRKRKEFRLVFRAGRRLQGKYISLQYLKTQGETRPARWAVIVSTKVSKSAVRRNRLRRRLQGHIKALSKEVQPNLDLVINVQSDFYQVDAQVIEAELQGLIKKIKT